MIDTYIFSKEDKLIKCIKGMAQRIIMHIDMNSYFASVEQQANPLLRGKSVGVCAYRSKNSCIVASSIEAKRRGIVTGCIVREALRRDPAITLIENDPLKYRYVTNKIFTLLKEYDEALKPYSIDEVFLDVTQHVERLITSQKRAARSTHGDLSVAEHVGKEIQQRITSEIGEWLGCSIGVSRTPFISKVLSDNGKKGAVTVCAPESIPELIAHLSLTDIWGINIRTKKRLENIGVTTPQELYDADPITIIRALNKPGYCLWAGIRGDTIVQSVPSKTAPKSIGHSYSIPSTIRTSQERARILMKLCEKTGRRLRVADKEASCISVHWSYYTGKGEHYSIKTPQPIYDSLDIFAHAHQFFSKSSNIKNIKTIAVSVSRLQETTAQQNLFKETESEEHKKRALIGACDEINNKYGEWSVIRGAMHSTRDHATDRIGFRKIEMINTG